MSLSIQLFKHPPFPGKMINYCIPSIQTPTFEIIIPISTLCGAQTGVVERLLAFNSLCGATARVTEHLAYYRRLIFECLLDYYSRFRLSTRLYSHCGARTGVAKRVRAFDSLCGAQKGVAKRVL